MHYALAAAVPPPWRQILRHLERTARRRHGGGGGDAGKHIGDVRPVFVEVGKDVGIAPAGCARKQRTVNRRAVLQRAADVYVDEHPVLAVKRESEPGVGVAGRIVDLDPAELDRRRGSERLRRLRRVAVDAGVAARAVRIRLQRVVVQRVARVDCGGADLRLEPDRLRAVGDVALHRQEMHVDRGDLVVDRGRGPGTIDTELLPISGAALLVPRDHVGYVLGPRNEKRIGIDHSGALVVGAEVVDAVVDVGAKHGIGDVDDAARGDLDVGGVVQRSPAGVVAGKDAVLDVRGADHDVDGASGEAGIDEVVGEGRAVDVNRLRRRAEIEDDRRGTSRPADPNM